MDCGVFTISELTRFRRHEHEEGHVCAVLQGGMSQRVGRTWRDVSAGTIRLSGGARHDIDFGPAGARCLVLGVAQDVEPELLRLPRAQFFVPDQWLQSLILRIAAAFERRDPASNLMLDTATAELVAQLLRRTRGRQSPPPRWLVRTREMIHDSSGAVRLADAAREAGVHRVHLARAFKDHFGASFTEFSMTVRLGLACQLLHTDLPIAQIAVRSGFWDQSHLTRNMQKHFGAPPASFRRAMLHPCKTRRTALP